MPRKPASHGAAGGEGDGAAAGGGANKSDAQLWSALKKSDIDELRELLFDRIEDAETGSVYFSPKPTAKALVNHPNAKKNLPLSFAVAQEMEEEGVHLLLRAGANINGKDQTKEQSTALHSACWGADDILIQLLIRCGADPRVQDGEGRTVLHVLASSNSAPIVTYLLETIGATPTRQEGLLYLDGHPQLMVDPVELLKVTDKRGLTALHVAVGEMGFGNAGVAEAMVDYLEHHIEEQEDERDRAAVKAKVRDLLRQRYGETRDTVLHSLLASPNGNEEPILAMAGRLLKLGADPFLLNADGQDCIAVAAENLSSATSTPLFTALLNGMVAFMQTNEEVPANAMESSFTTLDEDGYALIHIIIRRGNVAAAKAVADYVRKQKSAEAAENTRRWLRETKTKEGQSTVELLAAAERAADDMAQALIDLGVIDAEAYKELRAEYVAAAREQVAAAEAAAAEDDEEEEADGVEGAAAAGGAGRGKGDFSGFGTGKQPGVSRVQQARKARAQANAARREGRAAGGDYGGQGAKTEGAFGSQMSTPVKVFAALLLVSLFVSAYMVISGSGQ